MKDEPHKSVDHGQLKPVSKPAKKHPRIPMQFRGQVIDVMTSDTGAMSYEHSARKYGIWKVRALKPFSYFHKPIAVGDVLEMIGNHAVFMALDGDLEFIDERLAAEERVAREAASLGIPLQAKDNPAFARREPHDSTVAHSNRR